MKGINVEVSYHTNMLMLSSLVLGTWEVYIFQIIRESELHLPKLLDCYRHRPNALVGTELVAKAIQRHVHRITQWLMKFMQTKPLYDGRVTYQPRNEQI